MLGWFAPACPLDTGEKMWTEHRMRWLAGKLGLDRLTGCEVVLPQHRFFPDPYSGTPADARRIFERVCGYMKLEPDRFDFAVVPADSIKGAAGLYCGGERPSILVADAQLSDPERLVATVAHELAHDILLGGGLLNRDECDHEEVTDLVPVFLGLGLFAANSPVRERSYTESNWHYFKIDRQGYLPSRTIGYALALFAFARREAKPAWARYLRPDAAEPLKTGLRYLQRTGDSLFHPDTAGQPDRPPTEAEMVERLATGSPTIRAFTIGEIAKLKPPPAALIEAVARHLGDPDHDVQIEAVRLLPLFGETAKAFVPDLIRCLRARSATVRCYAAQALAAVGAPAYQAVSELMGLLQDPDSMVVNAAGVGLCDYAHSAASAVPALVEAVRKKEVNCQSSDTLADTLIAIDPPADVLEPLLDPIDPELHRLISKALRAARTRRESNRQAVAGTNSARDSDVSSQSCGEPV